VLANSLGFHAAMFESVASINYCTNINVVKLLVTDGNSSVPFIMVVEYALCIWSGVNSIRC